MSKPGAKKRINPRLDLVITYHLCRHRLPDDASAARHDRMQALASEANDTMSPGLFCRLGTICSCFMVTVRRQCQLLLACTSISSRLANMCLGCHLSLEQAGIEDSSSRSARRCSAQWQPPSKSWLSAEGSLDCPLALILEAYGLQYELLEKHADVASRLGAGVGLTPNGARMLDQLGVWDKVCENGSSMDAGDAVCLDGSSLVQNENKGVWLEKL